MSTYAPNERQRTMSGNAGGGWIVGIIVVVLIGLGIWWWTGTSGAGPRLWSLQAPAQSCRLCAAPPGSAK